MLEYQRIVKQILEHGQWKDNRTGTRTLTCPNLVFSHDMSEGFPLLTTKKMAYKSMAVELEGFIKGITDKRWFQKRNCHIWDLWGNPHVVRQMLKDNNKLTHKEAQKECKDLGPLGYSWQWRRFNEVYDEDDDGCLKGYDQLANIVKTLQTNPNDRRMVCSAVNPLQQSRMALPACHTMWILTHINGVLSLSWTQRSIDTLLGLPFNIASYALLLTLLCKVGNFKPGNLTGLLCDCHIYEDHIDGAKEQLTRTPYELPTVEIFEHDEPNFDIFNWTHNEFKPVNYISHPKIKFPIAV